MAFSIATSAAAAPIMTMASGATSFGHVFGQIMSWILAIVIVAAALGMVVSRKLIHSALCLLLVMIGVAIEYAAMDAPFVFAVQIVVYAGAIMVMFLFIVMMVGTEAKVKGTEPIPGQRIAAVIMSLAMVILMAVAITLVSWQDPAGLEEAHRDAGGNIPGLGELIFGDYVVIFELLSALLIIAAVGAMVVTLRSRVTTRPSQKEYSQARFRAYAEKGIDVGAMAGPGVYSRSNAMDVPALLPDGSEMPPSVSENLRVRGDVRSAHDLADKTAQVYSDVDEYEEKDN